ncbi:hypothetical protein GCM10027020_05640 [Nocardioides salsibiostraticola]
MTIWRSVISAVMLVSVTACGGSIDSSPTLGGTSADVETFTATGVLTLALPLMSDSIEGNLDLCLRQMPVQLGRQITIENAQDEVVGFGTLKPPDFDPTDGTCRSSWTAKGVPASVEVYSLVVGDDYRPIYFRQSEGEAGMVSSFPASATP